jgi:hypothetical protein
MGDIINDLTGGYFRKNKNTIIENKKNTYSVFIKFDDDEPIEMYKDINNDDSIELSISNTEKENLLEFKCINSGKKFKIYAK